MREHEMRTRVFRFLKARMRNMVMPATFGLGLAVGGCSDATIETPPPPPKHDGSLPGIPIYSSPAPDSSIPGNADAILPDGAGLVSDVPATSSDASPDLLPSPDSAPDVTASKDHVVTLDAGGMDGGAFDAPAPDLGGTDGGALDAPAPDLGGITTKYIAPVPDAGPDLGNITTKYIAQTPEDGGPTVRYMAQMPDSGGGAVPLYLAQAPNDRSGSPT